MSGAGVLMLLSGTAFACTNFRGEMVTNAENSAGYRRGHEHG